MLACATEFDRMLPWQVAEQIRHVLADYNEIMPTIVEIPSKDHPYAPDKDTMYMRILRLMGRAG